MSNPATHGIGDLLVKIRGQFYLVPAEAIGAPLDGGSALLGMLDSETRNLGDAKPGSIELAIELGETNEDRDARAITPREARQCVREARQCTRDARQCVREARQCTREARQCTREARQCVREAEPRQARQCIREARQCTRQARQCTREARAINPLGA